ncbi:hypothetical protein ES702_00207 [subsurface metagenome]
MATDIDTSLSVQTELRVTFQKRFMSMTQSISVGQCSRMTPEDKQLHPFHFNVRSWLQQSIEEKPYFNMMLGMQNNFLPLPPSLQHKVQPPPGRDGLRAEAVVTYQLSAYFFHGNQVISSVRQPLLLLFSPGPSPPLYLGDYTDEYQLHQRAKLRNIFFRGVGGLELQAQQPMPLRIKVGAETASVGIPLSMRLHLTKSNPSLYDYGHLEADVDWQICSSTFVSMCEQYKPPTVKEVSMSPSSFLIRSGSPARRLRMVWREFRAVHDNAKTIESVQVLRLSIPQIYNLTPTFWSQFLARRYIISLQVRVAGPANATIKLRVPVQVEVEGLPFDVDARGSACSDDSHSRLWVDDDNHRELLPVYPGV